MKLNVWLVTIFAAFGGFMFGYDTGLAHIYVQLRIYQLTISCTG
jgi:hypothetical protein